MEKLKQILPGFIFCLIISLISMYISKLSSSIIVIESLTLAIIIGMIYNNIIGTQRILEIGVKYSLKKLLKLGIVLLGFKLNLFNLYETGLPILISVLIFVPVTLILYMIMGKLFKIESKLSTLMGVGSCICGASAVVAIGEAINSNDDDSVIAVSVVSFLGAIGVIVYSIIANISPMNNLEYGVFSGLTLQGVAHALAAAFARGSESGEIGTIVKMTRVLMLVPISLILSYYFSKKNNKNTEGEIVVKKAKFPLYVLYFIMAALINSIGIIPQEITYYLTKISSLLILISMTAMGLSVNFKSILNKGLKALALASFLFTLISTISYFLIILYI